MYFAKKCLIRLLDGTILVSLGNTQSSMHKIEDWSLKTIQISLRKKKYAREKYAAVHQQNSHAE